MIELSFSAANDSEQGPRRSKGPVPPPTAAQFQVARNPNSPWLGQFAARLAQKRVTKQEEYRDKERLRAFKTAAEARPEAV